MKYFTKGQLEEIRLQMATQSVRDSDLEWADQLTGEESVVVLQDGELRRVTINNIMDFILDNDQEQEAR